MNRRVLIVDGDGARARQIAAALDGYHAPHVDSAAAAMAAVCEGRWSAMVVAYLLARDDSGLEVLQMLRHHLPCTFRLLHMPICDPYMLEDVQRIGQPHVLLHSANGELGGTLRQRIDELFAPGPLDAPDRFEPLTVHTTWSAYAPVSRQFLAELRQAAESDAPVYLYGEPGAGAERAALMLRRWRAEWRSRGAPGRTPDPLVCVLRVPSLRERLQDVPVLAQRCLAEQARITGEPIRSLAPDAVQVLLDREWRGNAIELRGTLVRACQRAGTRPVITAADLPSDRDPPWRATQVAKDDGQRDCVLRQLKARRSVTRAAETDGAPRGNYIRIMRRLGIVRADVRTDADA